MKRLLVSLALFLGVSLQVAASSSAEREVASDPMPSIIGPPAKDSLSATDDDAPVLKYPTWVAAASAFNADETIDREYFSAFVADTIERRIRQIPRLDNGCIPYGSPKADVDHAYRERLDTAIQRSGWVLVGKVTGRELGFHAWSAGQLIRLEIEESLRGELRDREPLYVFFPVGAFVAGGHKICADDDRYPAPPEIGDRLVLAVDEPGWDLEPLTPLVDTGQHTGIITLPAAGEPQLPAQQGGQPRLESRDAEGILEWVKSQLFGSKEGSR